MGIEIRVEKNTLPGWNIADPWFVCNEMRSYFNKEYIAFVYVDGKRNDLICSNCLREGPERARQMLLERVEVLDKYLILARAATSEITGPWGDHEIISKIP